mmetsp:Transcript_10032/g.23452  ORF Transcript_10032/g.23452 Transcript_10032/m.23452 type:complete len:95 (+) Transcript_10032:62-346(+)
MAWEDTSWFGGIASARSILTLQHALETERLETCFDTICYISTEETSSASTRSARGNSHTAASTCLLDRRKLTQIGDQTSRPRLTQKQCHDRGEC